MYGLRISLIIMLAWLSIMLWSGPVGKPPSSLEENRTKGNQPPVVTPGVGDEAESALPVVRPYVGVEDPGSSPVPPARPGSDISFRAPAQVAALIKRNNLETVVGKYARKYGVDEDLIWAVMRQESGFNPVAVSPRGAMGLMQLMPGTAALMGVSEPFDVEQNIAGGVRYLGQCLTQFNHDVPLALAAYNAGPANVVKYQGCPPFAETRQYIASVLQAYAGEPINCDMQLGRMSYLPGEAPAAPPAPEGLPWRVPLPRWKIVIPHSRLAAPQWKAALPPF
jgi:hypothetical protein